MDQKEILTHQLSNLFQSTLLLGGMGLLLGGVGWILGGVYGFILTLVLSILLLLLTPHASPRLILPLYRAQQIFPENAPHLFALVKELAHRAKLPIIPQLYYLPSSMLNAFAVGSRKDCAITVTDGLLRGMSFREITGVLAHEIAHIQNNDTWLMGLADSVTSLTRLLSLLGQVLFLINLPLMWVERQGIPWLLVILLIVAPLFSMFFQLALSRTREFDADLDGVRLTGDPLGLASALKKIHVRTRLWEQIILPGRRVPEPSLLRTHPGLQERIKRLEALEGTELRDEITHLHPITYHQMVPPIVRRPRYHWSGLWF